MKPNHRILVTFAAWTLCASLPGAAPPVPRVEELVKAPYAPKVLVVDTVSSLGPLARDFQEVTLLDLVRFHGHACDGLVAAAVGLAYGLRQLFPTGPVDRTDLEVAVNASACYGDVAAYLTGARHRYGTLHVDPQLGDEWILRRRSTDQTVRVRLKDGVKPAELPALEATLRGEECPAELIERVQRIQTEFARRLVQLPPDELFVLEFPANFPYPPGPPRPDTVKARCPQQP
ncbi:MAG: hypothetical protein Kow00109_17670 [Acidobacteriota bacterium]